MSSVASSHATGNNDGSSERLPQRDDSQIRREGLAEKAHPFVSATERAKRAVDRRNDGTPKGGKDHPATSEIDYQPDEIEYMRAIEDFKKATGRKFPTWTDALKVAKSIGYRRDKPVERFKARTGRRFPTFRDCLAIAESLGYPRDNN